MDTSYSPKNDSTFFPPSQGGGRGWVFSFFLVFLSLLFACKKEIDFDYNEIDPIVIVEGRVTNEDMSVVITKSRSVLDSVKGRCLTGADVVIACEGTKTVLPYDAAHGCYYSPLTGVPGKTYTMTVDFEGQHYEATSTMTAPAPILTVEFLWQPVMKERLLAYELWGVDPEPDVRNCFWYRMDRTFHHPHFVEHKPTGAYRWSVFEDRGNLPGKLSLDVMCMSERAAEEDKEENWKGILYEGDTVTFQLMTIDRPTYDYFSSLRAGQSGGANPRSNITGGCQGYFTAGSITHADTLVFRYDIVKEVR
jgi:hypothetical protein